MHRSIALALSCLLATACATEPTSDDRPQVGDAAGQSAPEQATPSENRTASAVRVLERGGDFGFSLRDSAVADQVRARCEARGASQVEACIEEMIASAAGEGVAFSPAGDGLTRFVSYAQEEGERVILIEALVRFEDLGDGLVEIRGERLLKGPKLPLDTRLLIDVVDEDTIAMDKQPGAHPRSGGARLVFHRSAE
ncbi:MAG: hypothetical protein KC731_26045 [Myxococcales bacterium]|nr:hypothetical protein [Myxococcales bacterium]